MRPDQVLVKLDFIPEIYPFDLQAYSAPTVLRFGHLLLTSEIGPQQGDPLGPLLFSLPLQPVLHTLTSEFKIGFLDDVTLGGNAGGVGHDLQIMTKLKTSMGLCLNQSKCEVYAPDLSLTQESPHLLKWTSQWSSFW